MLSNSSYTDGWDNLMGSNGLWPRASYSPRICTMTVRRHPAFKRPAKSAMKIWRFMSLAKFIWLIEKNALFFCRSDLLGDPFEGHHSRVSVHLLSDVTRAAEQDPTIAWRLDNDPDFDFRQLDKKTVFVNCWHMNEQDSLEMWKLYAPQKDSVCIQSHVKSLASLLPDKCFLGAVNYIDYDNDSIFIRYGIEHIVHKRQVYMHERELRAVLWTQRIKHSFPVGDGGIAVPVDLNSLIQNILVSPNSDLATMEVLVCLARKYAIRAPIQKSNLYAPPDY